MATETGIYEIVNTVNGKRYIGQAANMGKRHAQHKWHLRKNKHHSRYLQAAWNKYGEGAFKFLPILTCQPSMLDFYEQQLLDKVSPEYNVSPSAGTCRGVVHTPEQRARMLGNKYSLGVKHPPEFGAAISARNTGKKKPPEQVEKSAKARTGMKRTQEQRDRMSAAHAGKKLSAEHRAAQSAGRTGRVPTGEHKANVSLGKRAANDAKHPPSARTLQRRADFDALK